MKRLRLHSSYELANNDQVALLAADIGAKVEFIREPDIDGTSSGYALMVDEERFEDAKALLVPPPIENHAALLRCPACGSDRITEPNPPFFGAFLLGIPIVLHVIRRWFSGSEYRCEACRNVFRKRP